MSKQREPSIAFPLFLLIMAVVAVLGAIFAPGEDQRGAALMVAIVFGLPFLIGICLAAWGPEGDNKDNQ